MPLPTSPKAVILTIGDELLIGQTLDTNSGWLAQQLQPLGIMVVRRVAIADSRDAILGALEEELRRADVIITTGGLGPTSDDITKPLLAEMFGDGAMETDQKVLAHVTEIFASRKRPLLPANARQADVPRGAAVLFNRMGTAPGLWFEREGKIVIALPGVPYEMTTITEDEVLPRLRSHLPGGGAVVHRTIVTAGTGESFVAARLEAEEAALPPHIKLAYLPSPGIVRLRLTGRTDAGDETVLVREVELHRDALLARLRELVVATDDLPLEHILGKALLAEGLTLGLAESCTGGGIANKVTNIMGSAGYLQGGIVCYQESVKEELLNVKRDTIDVCCIVSEDVAVEMAAGARTALDSNVGFGITGVLSAGGTDRVPVGTVCMAVTDGTRTVSRTHHFHLDRLRNKELAIQHALLLILRFVQKKE